MALQRQIYTLGNRPGFRQQYIQQAVLLRDEASVLVADPVADVAFGVAGDTYQFFHDLFGRDSYNNGGRPIRIYIHRGRRVRAVEYLHTGTADLITAGDGNSEYNSPIAAPDILSHEITHAYVHYLATMRYGLTDAGVIIEHLCDVFAWLIVRHAAGAAPGWDIGAGFHKQERAIRNLRTPNDGGLAMPCAAHANQLRDVDRRQRNLYFNAGVLNCVFAETVEAVGDAEVDGVAAVWYAVTERLPQQPSLQDFRDELIDVATGGSVTVLGAVQRALGIVGL